MISSLRAWRASLFPAMASSAFQGPSGLQLFSIWELLDLLIRASKQVKLERSFEVNELQGGSQFGNHNDLWVTCDLKFFENPTNHHIFFRCDDSG